MGSPARNVALQASWVGTKQYNSATSSQASVTALPMFILVLIVALVDVTIFAVALFKTICKKPASLNIQPSERALSPPNAADA